MSPESARMLQTILAVAGVLVTALSPLFLLMLGMKADISVIKSELRMTREETRGLPAQVAVLESIFRGTTCPWYRDCLKGINNDKS